MRRTVGEAKTPFRRRLRGICRNRRSHSATYPPQRPAPDPGGKACRFTDTSWLGVQIASGQTFSTATRRPTARTGQEPCWNGSSTSAGPRPEPGSTRSSASSAPRICATARPGLTGGLIFLDGAFVQVLEGSPEAVGRLQARLLRDPRHTGMDLRARERALCRLFHGQAMALRTRACLDPLLLDAFGYAPGFPVARFPADALLEFVVRACRPVRGPLRPARVRADPAIGTGAG